MKFDEYLNGVEQCLLDNYHLSKDVCSSILRRSLEDILYLYEKGYSKEEVSKRIINAKGVK